MEEIRLGPIEWGVVTAHYRWGLGVRLEESGDEGVIVLDSIHDDFLRCNGEYWPEIGERIRFAERVIRFSSILCKRRLHNRYDKYTVFECSVGFTGKRLNAQRNAQNFPQHFNYYR